MTHSLFFPLHFLAFHSCPDSLRRRVLQDRIAFPSFLIDFFSLIWNWSRGLFVHVGVGTWVTSHEDSSLRALMNNVLHSLGFSVFLFFFLYALFLAKLTNFKRYLRGRTYSMTQNFVVLYEEMFLFCFSGHHLSLVLTKRRWRSFPVR